MTTPLKIFSAAFFGLASIFCFASFVPYTYLFLVKNPPYAWLSWFMAHGPLLYCCALAAAVSGLWPQRDSKTVRAAVITQAVVGVVFTYKNVLKTSDENWSAYAWSIVLLLPLLMANLRVLASILAAKDSRELRSSASEKSVKAAQLTNGAAMVPYSTGVAVALLAAGLSIGGGLVRQYSEMRKVLFHSKEGELAIFVVVTYLWLAVLIVSGLNALHLLVRKRSEIANAVRLWTLYALVVAAIDISVVRFMGNGLSVRGWYVQVYALVLGASIAGWIFVIFGATRGNAGTKGSEFWRRVSAWVILACLAAAALAVPTWIGNGDWNGVLDGSFNLLLLILLSGLVSIVVQGTRTREYSIWAIVAVVLVSTFFYGAINTSGFLWAKELGKTDDEVTMSLETYAGQNTGFGMLESVLNPPNREPCGEFCLTLRQYTNVLNARAKTPLRLVDNLSPTKGPRPNIFIFVIDSMRRDYVGAYNPAVDFTPNMDSLAKDSVVMRKAFTQYAGTSLSEPAIWAGSLLLHAHFMRPFDNVDSLLTLVKTDGYQIVVSRDQMLGKLLPQDDGIVSLDLGKNFNEFEISATLQQLEAYLRSRQDPQRPIFFYAQPMNIHELGVNNLPAMTESNWRRRRGFNDRVAFKLQQVDEFLGQFIAFLKASHLYDNSIIIITADHGDGTPTLPGFGLVRRNHSTILFPEIMRVPLIIRLPAGMRSGLVYDEDRLAALTDITPSLYYLLGHRPIKHEAIFGRPMFASSGEELHSYDRDHLLLASDARAAYGILSGDARTMYVTYDSPQMSLLFDLAHDPDGLTNALVDSMKPQYDREIMADLRAIAAYYDYKPDGGWSGQFSWDR